ncbi:hypothetical protein [uncultured Methanobrevibacter sp.]|uniref:hypothetical protein n=1 Tax=uncultured Methanobrevibacter sp. TaxID=253161 RepID=UPI0025E9760E|nr:hypothetical protein [uncultured Methanobrevibacter sp.]
MSELKELINNYIELEEKLDEIEDNESEEFQTLAGELHDMGHEIDHLVYNEEFVIVYNADTEDDEVIALIISDEEEDREEFLIPVYTDEEEAKKAIESFSDESGEANFKCDKANGNAIVQAYADDEEFLGLAINAPQCDFVIFAEEVHDCCD